MQAFCKASVKWIIRINCHCEPGLIGRVNLVVKGWDCHACVPKR